MYEVPCPKESIVVGCSIMDVCIVHYFVDSLRSIRRIVALKIIKGSPACHPRSAQLGIKCYSRYLYHYH